MKKVFKKIFKSAVIVLSILILGVVVYYGKAYYSVEERIHRRYDVDVKKLVIVSDSAALSEGERLTAIKGCKDCHDKDLGGKMFIDHPLMGTLAAPNLTKGKGGLPNNFNSEDWLRALQHGLRQDLTPLMVMPSHKFALLTKNDITAIIAYCQRLDPVNRSFAEPSLGPLARVLADMGKIDLLPAELIDHDRALVSEVKAEVSLSFGRYLANSCTGCHQGNLKGDKALAEGQPVPPDISSTGNPGKWTYEQFALALRTGVTPEGKNLNPNYMPWKMTKEFTDVELKALLLYLKNQ